VKVKTLESLSISPLLSYPPTLSWDAEASKPDKGIYEYALGICEEEGGEGVIMVGDELKAKVLFL
jgi:phosphoglycolate phosphatase-like HAD superfamily hydrolase